MKKLFLIPLVLLLFACNKEKVYYQNSKSFKEQGFWARFEHVQFDVPIENTKINYDIILDINYSNIIDFDIIPIHVIMTTDDGEERIREFNFKIKDHNGNFIGALQTDGSYTYSNIIRQNFKMTEPKIVHIDLECFHPKFQIKYINNIAVRLIKTNSPSKSKNKK